MWKVMLVDLMVTLLTAVEALNTLFALREKERRRSAWLKCISP